MASFRSLITGFTKLYFYRLLKKRFPLNVFFVVTNKCNLKCGYCYGEYYNRKNFREFTTEEIIDTLYTLKKMGTVFLQIQGGEPLVRNDISELIETARKLNFNVDLITNGLLIKEKIDAVKLLDSICISLDGRRSINDKNRGEGTFDKIVEGINICRKSGISTRINSVITNETEEDDIKFLMEFSKENRCLLNFCPSFHFNPLTTDKKYSIFNYDRSKYNKLLDLIIDYKKKKYPVQFTIKAYELPKNWPFSLEKQTALKKEIPSNYNHIKCYHADYVCFIDGDGRLYPCCNFWNDYKPINIHDMNFENAWKKLDRLECAACYIHSYIDRNQLMNFNFSTLKNYFNNYIFDLKTKFKNRS
ncbi:radical SAM protein [Candidatus Dependentiae bacterium]|nr:radical SAM protein [Candidatus Dependentiae bacterium]